LTRLRRWIRFSRAKALGAGVALLAVPTFFTVFPTWTDWHPSVRIGIVVVWLLIAAAVVASEIVRGEAIAAITTERREIARNLRLVATREVLEALLRSSTRGIPDHYELTLYLYDEEKDKLLPYFPTIDFRGEADPRVFDPGKGATGTAWRDRGIVVVTGTEVSSDKYGLTDVQQEYFKDYQSVASAVVWEEAATPIGVVSALGTADDGYFSGPPGRDSRSPLAAGDP
jgi:hypothetical protein